MSFQARYRGQCAEGDVIVPGDNVAYNEDDELIHVACMEKGPPRPVEICAYCWLQKPCGCEDE